eukprot:2084814-Prymnesium_polylepis.1
MTCIHVHVWAKACQRHRRAAYRSSTAFWRTIGHRPFLGMPHECRPPPSAAHVATCHPAPAPGAPLRRLAARAFAHSPAPRPQFPCVLSPDPVTTPGCP